MTFYKVCSSCVLLFANSPAQLWPWRLVCLPCQLWLPGPAPMGRRALSPRALARHRGCATKFSRRCRPMAMPGTRDTGGGTRRAPTITGHPASGSGHRGSACCGPRRGGDTWPAYMRSIRAIGAKTSAFTAACAMAMAMTAAAMTAGTGTAARSTTTGRTPILAACMSTRSMIGLDGAVALLAGSAITAAAAAYVPLPRTTGRALHSAAAR